MKKILFGFGLLMLSVNAFAQYCASNATSTADGETWNVTLGTLNNTSSNCNNALNGSACVGIGIPRQYSDFTICGPLGTYLAGLSYPLSIWGNTCNGNFQYVIKVYIDYNQNFSFTDPGELVYTGPSTTGGTLVPFFATSNITIPITALAGTTRMRVVQVETTLPANVLPCGTYTWGETEDYMISIIPPTPCAGQVSAGTIAPDTVNLCPASTTVLQPTGGSLAADIAYQWLSSTNGGATWNIMANDTNPTLFIPAGTPTQSYALSVICLNNFSLDTTNACYVSVQLPTPALLPYTQDFEQWYDYCATADVPGYEWVNTPFFGGTSWRRNDQGSTAGWPNVGLGAYIPSASSNNHSARFHNYGSGGSTGTLDLYLDLSGTIGANTLFVDHINNSFGGDIDVMESVNGAAGPFTILQTLGSAGSWTQSTIPITSTASNYVLRFRGNGSSFDDDMGIDNIMVVEPCDNSVSGGNVPDSLVCPNKPFLLKTIGSTLASGLVYTWQSSTSTGGPWVTVGTSITPTFLNLPGISTPTYFRVVVTCTATGATNTSNFGYYTLRDFYYCYCDAATTSAFDDFDIGNYKLEADSTGSPNFGVLIDNVPLTATDTFGNPAAVKSYTQFWNLPLRKIYRDSTYRVSITNINQATFSPFGASVVYIDYNRDGNFDPIELAAGGNIANSYITSSFKVPANAQIGITGMRVISASITPANSVPPCGLGANEGEVEDYLIELSTPPCKAPTNPGVAFISDTLLCPGYQVIMYDTGHTSLTNYQGLSSIWQVSPNLTTWSDIAGTANLDTAATIVNGNSYFRYRIICANGDTAYSNVLKVTMNSPLACYPASATFGGPNDSCDLGYFTMGAYKFSSAGATGPHLGNPAAIRKRTEFIQLSDVMTLYTDSTYKLSFYSILRPYIHADAKVTVFIDYNNNLIYDLPQERVYTGISGPLTFYLPATVKTPINPVLNTITGMRVIINNDVLPNAASDNGVGLYTSGETEDYIVRFLQKPLALNELENSIVALDMYPNPTNGMLYIDMEAKDISNLDLTVYSLTGAEVAKKSYQNVNGNFSTTLNLTSLPKGIYTIKLASEKGNLVRRIVIE